MNRLDVQIALVKIAQDLRVWAKAKAQFDDNVTRMMKRLMNEAAINYMSVEDVAAHSGMTVKRVRAEMRKAGMDPWSNRHLLAKRAAKTLASNAELLGVNPRDMDLTSPLAYLPMGDELRQEIRDKTAPSVHELPDEDDAAFYAEHYSDWIVHAIPMTVYVPAKDDDRDEAVALVREILDEAAFDIRISVSGNTGGCPACGESVWCGNCGTNR